MSTKLGIKITVTRNTPTVFCFMLILLVACSSHKLKTPNDELTTLFNRTSKVQVLSYVNRMYEAPMVEGEKNMPLEKDTVYFRMADLAILESSIKEKLMLSNIQRDSLFSLLKTDMCPNDGVAICYEPRHALIFLDSKDQPFAYIELCFSCTNYQTSGSFQLDFCYEKSEALKNLLQSFGIRYFSEGEF